jgi:hypothetical protein
MAVRVEPEPAVRIEAENAISFLTAAVRIPPDWYSPLMNPEPLTVAWPGKTVIEESEAPEEALWRSNQPAQAAAGDAAAVSPGAEPLWELQTYRRLITHFENRVEPGSRLLSLGDVAGALQQRFPDELRTAGIGCPTLLCPRRRRGFLEYHQLYWLDSAYFSVSGRHDPTANVLAFRPRDLEHSEPWREFLLATPDTDAAPYDEVAAVYNVLGMLAQRRTSLLAVSAQRRLCKIALPWARCRFIRHDGKRTREYLLVPVLTLFSRRVTTQFRRTVTLTLFLLPNERDTGLPLDATDLAALCHQSVWANQRPPLPMLDGSDGLGGRSLAGPLHRFIEPFLTAHERHLPGVFDVILRSAIRALGVAPAVRNQAQSVRMLVAISRARSAVFGSALHVEGSHSPSVWERLTQMSQGDVAENFGKLLSFNAAREGREWLVSGEGFGLAKMRVTNPYEEDTNAIAFYNPMSRYLANVMPQHREGYPTSLKMGVAWLNLLAGAISLIKEIMRSYRYEVEQHRNRIEALRSSESSDGRAKAAAELKEVHKTTLEILEELDVVYSFELVGQSYKAAHACVLEMEGVTQEREYLLKELEITTSLLRSEESDQLTQDIASSTSRTEELSKQIAESTKSTDDLTKAVLIFTAVLTALAVKDLLKLAVEEPLRQNWLFWTTAALIVVYIVWTIVFFRSRKRRAEAAGGASTH